MITSTATSSKLQYFSSSHSLSSLSPFQQSSLDTKAFTSCSSPAKKKQAPATTTSIKCMAVETTKTAVKKKNAYEIQTLTGWLLKQEQAGVIDAELTIVLSSISMACKQIASLVQRASISNLTGVQGAVNIQGEDQKKLDVISNEVFSNCLRSSGRTGIIASEEEDVPVAVEESYSGNYIVVFDPLDGSSNIDAAVSTGSIFGIYHPNDECLADYSDEDSLLDSEEQKNRSLCIQLRPHMWDDKLKKYIDDLKDPGPTGKPYSARYIGSLVGDFHRTLLYGGIYGYPRDTKSKNGKLRLLYECAPMSYLAEQAGGKGSDGHSRVLDIMPTEIHQRVPLYIGSPDEVDKLEKYLA
ncbi:Fructose-bisphosphatase [Heracleum sosnowskyi]|uniref:fructose-bisphosphatase n=1 Tax=Heracleum sosnowskyi TaxID=360622 RepID=A0AAD8I2Q1_9APIA|nr:Fructose-bisphosphatase [Heracleum sosnowskyi]